MSNAVIPLATDLNAIVASGSPTAIAYDLSQTLRQFGVESARIALIELTSQHCHAIWTVDEQGEVSRRRPTRGLASAFSLGTAIVSELMQIPAGVPVVRRLSPHIWAYAWRVDEHNGVLAQIHSVEGRFKPSETGTAVVRAICDMTIGAGEAAQTDGAAEESGPVWPRVDRRAPARPPLAARAALVLIGVAAVLSAWMAFRGLTEARDDSAALYAELGRLETMAERTMIRELSTVLAGGDYGEVQEALSSYADLGYFQAAVVTNMQKQIVASAGSIGSLRIGGQVPDTVARWARASDLTLGAQRNGQLLELPRSAGAPLPRDGASLGVLRLVSALAFVSLITVGILLAWTLWQRGRLPRLKLPKSPG